mmetsp:Transcript_802/g.1473  ORF Transcript_802/g.1473 Transcript_802/m.1473 type:complete len:226 (+) Transcript_802:610-1287(+)
MRLQISDITRISLPYIQKNYTKKNTKERGKCKTTSQNTFISFHILDFPLKQQLDLRHNTWCRIVHFASNCKTMATDSDTKRIFPVLLLSEGFRKPSFIFWEEAVRFELVEGMTLGDVHNPISRIVALWNLVASFLKESVDPIHLSLEHHLSFVHENETIKGIEYLGRRLMDGKKHTCTRVCYVLEDFAELNSRECVQPTCWLVQEHHGRPRDKLNPNRSPLSFTS